MTLPYLAKEATGIAKTFVSASISVLLSALPAYMLLILKNIVKENIGIGGRFFFLTAFAITAMVTSDATSKAFSSMALGIGIWILEYWVKACVQCTLNKHPIHF